MTSSNFSDSSDFRLTSSGHQEGDSSIFLQVISGLTLLVIPYSVNTEMDVQYSLMNAETGCRFEASVSDSYHTVAGLLLLPIAPFAQGGRTRTFDRVSGNLYAELAEKGAFQEHPSCEDADTKAASPEDRLRELERLRDEGLISEPEYQSKRQEILGGI